MFVLLVIFGARFGRYIAFAQVYLCLFFSAMCRHSMNRYEVSLDFVMSRSYIYTHIHREKMATDSSITMQLFLCGGRFVCGVHLSECGWHET